MLPAVCRAFQTSRRREVLGFTHHREVAALPPAEADALLDRAEAEGLSTRELRGEVAGRTARHRPASCPALVSTAPVAALLRAWVLTAG